MTDIAFPGAMATVILLPQLLEAIGAPRFVHLAVAVGGLAGAVLTGFFNFQVLVPDRYGGPISLLLMFGVVIGAAILVVSNLRNLASDTAEGS